MKVFLEVTLCKEGGKKSRSECFTKDAVEIWFYSLTRYFYGLIGINKSLFDEDL